MRSNLGEKCVETMDLLPLFQECVVLSDTTKSQLVHEVDLVRVLHMLVLENVQPRR
jgi:hypothetical protein